MGHSDRSRWLLAAAAVVGFGVSIYLTVAHYADAPLACAQGGVVNCDLVTRSSYGLIPGTMVPVSAAGIVWFGVSLVLALLSGPAGRLGGLVWAVAGTLVVLYLVYAEMRLGRICEWCTLVHVLVVLSLLVAVARASQLRPAD